MKLEDIIVGDEVEIDHEDFDGVWKIAEKDEIDLGIETIPINVIVQGDEWYTLVGWGEIDIMNSDDETIATIERGVITKP